MRCKPSAQAALFGLGNLLVPKVLRSSCSVWAGVGILVVEALYAQAFSCVPDWKHARTAV